MAVERFSKTGLALLMLAIGFFIGLAVGFIGAYHGSNYWYNEFRKENKQLEKKINQLQDLEDIWPEEK